MATQAGSGGYTLYNPDGSVKSFTPGATATTAQKTAGAASVATPAPASTSSAAPATTSAPAPQYLDQNHQPVSYETNNWGEKVLGRDATGYYTDSYGSIKHYDANNVFTGKVDALPKGVGAPATGTQTQPTATNQSTTQTTGGAPAPSSTPAGSTKAPPAVSLQPGSTDTAAVKQLQDYLVSKNLLTEGQKATGYGTYGPQTTKAVLDLQKQLGVDYNASGGGGIFGPKTLAAVQKAEQEAQANAGTGTTNPSGVTTNPTPTIQPTDSSNDPSDPTKGMNPVQRQIYLNQEFSKQVGLPDIKAQFDKVMQDQKDLAKEQQDKIDNINNNPWLSEGIRVKSIQKVQDSYKAQFDTLSHFETLYDSLYKSGQAQVEHMTTGAEADIAATNKLAQDQMNAAYALAKDNVVVSTGGRELLINKVTGKVVADLGPSNKTGSTSTGTAAERSANALSQYASTFVPGSIVPGKFAGNPTVTDPRTGKTVAGVPTLDSEGFLTPEAFKTAIRDSINQGITRLAFIKEFADFMVGAGGTISPKFGLTPAEAKAIGATIRK